MDNDNPLNLAYNPERLINNNEPSKELLESLRNLLEKEKNVPQTLTDSQLVLFLHACEFDLKKAKTCITEYYSARKNGPELFDNRDVTARADIQQTLKALYYGYCPVDTDDGYRIILHGIRDTSPSAYHMEVAMKVLFMSIEAAIMKGPPKGLIILFDMKGVRLTHLTRTKIGAIRKFCHYLQEALPVKLHAMHVMNGVTFFDKVLMLLKPFLKKEIYSMLHVHTPSVNMEEFYAKYIPKKSLPSDYGGDLPSIDELKAQHSKELETLVPYFIAEEKQRNGDIKSDTPVIENDFGKLEID